jgi:hypothetical protein
MLQNSINALTKMQAEADILTNEMTAIFSKYPNCETPEDMPATARNDWDLLHKQQREIFQFIARIESICDDFSRYYTINLS